MAVVVVAVLVAWVSSIGTPGHVDHWLHRTSYGALLDTARAMDLEAGEVRQFRAEDMDDLTRLRPVVPGDLDRGRGRGLVWVLAGDDGSRQVFIEVIDLGHGGEYGYGWSSHGVPRWPADTLGERWELGRDLGDGWWTVSFRLG